MTTRKHLTRGILAAALFAASPAMGQTAARSDNTAFGTTSAGFLLLGAGARGAALGGSFAAIANDVSALYWNPGGLALMTRPAVSMSSYDYLADTRYSWVGIAFPMDRGSRVIGFHGATFGFSGAPVYTIEAPEGDGTVYAVAESYVGATYAQNFSDRFSAGLTAKMITDQLGDTKATAFAVDFGTSFHAQVGARPIRASFTIQNLGSTLKHDGSGLNITSVREAPQDQVNIPQEPQPGRLRTKDWNLPTLFRVGLAFDFVNSAAAKVTLTSEFNQPNDSRPTGGGGLEWGLLNIGNTGFSATVRGGYTYQPDNDVEPDATAAGFTSTMSSQNNMDGVAFGGGLGFKRANFGLSVDYASRSLGILGRTNYFSASISW